MKKIFAISPLLLALSGAAFAQSAGDISVRLGATQIIPKVESGSLSAPSFFNAQVDVLKADQVGGGISYHFSEYLALDLPLMLPFEHEVIGAGSLAGVGKLATVKVIPVTLMGQFRPLGAKYSLRPYVAGGLTYAHTKETQATAVLNGLSGGSLSNPTTMDMKGKFGVTAQVGLNWAVTERIFLDVSAMKTFINGEGVLSTGQRVRLELNPVSYSAAVGYRF
jgi:outer membrane protein